MSTGLNIEYRTVGGIEGSIGIELLEVATFILDYSFFTWIFTESKHVGTSLNLRKMLGV